MAEPKTQPTAVTPEDFLNSVEPERRRNEGFQLLDVFSKATGWTPRMWGASIIGFGSYDYTYASGRSGTWMATGFSPRKAKLSIYIMPGYQDFSPILDRLGQHKLGKSCLYVTRLEVIDLAVLAELIEAGLARLAEIYPITPDPR